MIHRVFARSAADVAPSALAEHLHALALPVEPHFKGDDLGWTGAKLVLPGGGSPVQLDRFLLDADDLRPDLDRFAAELETLTYSPHHVPLMQHVIQTKQLFALRKPIDHADDARLDRLCLAVAQYLASRLDGVYQVDGAGWFAASGDVLVQEY